MNEMDLLLKELLTPELNSDDSTLVTSVYADSEVNKVNDNIRNPVGEFFEHAAMDRLAKSSDWTWDAPVTTAPFEKRKANLDFSDIDRDAQTYLERLRKDWPS